jgi:tetratricopeptide (TPR) repeat protein
MNARFDKQPTGTGAFDDEERMALARVDLKKGDVAGALEKLKSVIASDAPPPGAFSLCGHIYLQLELPERARPLFVKHLTLQPDSPDESYLLGSIHFQAGRNAQALAAWDAVLQQYPTYTGALFYRAVLRSQQGQAALARDDLDVLIKSIPVENPFFKPAKELLQRLDSQRVAPQAALSTPAAAGTHGARYPAAVLAQKAYKAGVE